MDGFATGDEVDIMSPPCFLFCRFFSGRRISSSDIITSKITRSQLRLLFLRSIQSRRRKGTPFRPFLRQPAREEIGTRQGQLTFEGGSFVGDGADDPATLTSNRF